MKNVFSCLLVFLCSFFYGVSQPAARPLTVGDAVPDYLIRNLVNYKTPTARLSDFKDKLLILDFMNTNCSSCMYHLARMDSLEPAYQGKLTLFSVTYETKARLLSVMQKGYGGKKLFSRFIAQDSLLKSRFPHQFISHMVWVYQGRVKAITKPEYVTAANIETVLRNELVHWPVKNDVGTYDGVAPLLIPNPEVLAPTNQLSLKYYSTLSPHMDGYGYSAGLYTDSANEVQRKYTINEPLLRLYLTACGKPFYFPPAAIVLEVADTGRFLFNGQGYPSAWKMQNAYCYQAAFPLTTSKSAILERMRNDLNFYLHLNGRLEKRRRQCMVIKQAGPQAPVTAPPSKHIIQVSGLVHQLNQVYGGTLFIDEVPDSRNIYIEELASMTDMQEFEKVLLLHGMSITAEEREIEVLVISDQKPPL